MASRRCPLSTGPSGISSDQRRLQLGKVLRSRSGQIAQLVIKEYVRHQAPGAVEPDCLGGFAVAVIVNLSEHSPEPRAKLKLQGARCRLPGSDRSDIPATATLAQGWLGCHVNTSFDAGGFQHKWRARPVTVAIPSAGQRTENLACPNCGRTVRVATVSRKWTVAVGLRRLSLVMVITLSSAFFAMMFHVLAGLPLWAVFAAPTVIFSLSTWLSHAEEEAGPIIWTGPLLKPRFTDYARIAGGRGNGLNCLNDDLPRRYVHELYSQVSE